jgi:hypothetical protein
MRSLVRLLFFSSILEHLFCMDITNEPCRDTQNKDYVAEFVVIITVHCKRFECTTGQDNVARRWSPYLERIRPSSITMT